MLTSTSASAFTCMHSRPPSTRCTPRTGRDAALVNRARQAAPHLVQAQPRGWPGHGEDDSGRLRRFTSPGCPSPRHRALEPQRQAPGALAPPRARAVGVRLRLARALLGRHLDRPRLGARRCAALPRSMLDTPHHSHPTFPAGRPFTPRQPVPTGVLISSGAAMLKPPTTAVRRVINVSAAVHTTAKSIATPSARV